MTFTLCTVYLERPSRGAGLDNGIVWQMLGIVRDVLRRRERGPRVVVTRVCDENRVFFSERHSAHTRYSTASRTRPVFHLYLQNIMLYRNDAIEEFNVDSTGDCGRLNLARNKIV